MQRAVVSTTRETGKNLPLPGCLPQWPVYQALLQLHRSYFLKALSEPETFTLDHKFAPSVMAIYRSASCLISTMEALFSQEPQLSVRFMCFWFNSFSAGVSYSKFKSLCLTWLWTRSSCAYLYHGHPVAL
jgi:hypothetical protein